MTASMKSDGGWTTYGGSSRKFHYTDGAPDFKALCGKWCKSPFARQDPDLEPDTGPNPDDCVACRRKLDKRAASGGAER